jgi:hypothetical protein
MKSAVAPRALVGRPFAALLSKIRLAFVGAALAVAMLCSFPPRSSADESGVSFWLPGLFGSLAAVPQQPGWSEASIYYHTSVSADGSVSLAREFQIGNIPATATARASANINGTGDVGLFVPSYVFATPVFGGQAAANVMAIYGNSSAALAGTVTGTVGGAPFGPRFDNLSNSTTGFGDLYPMLVQRWHSGVDNYMIYVDGDVPVGDYTSRSLANLGIGHGAVDSGAGYTYFDPQSGHELSAVLGLTYNLVDSSTQYQNGVDMHLDWAASQFLTKQVQVGVVGDVYDQVSCDGGSGDHVGCFESRVVGVGPQLGFLFPLGTLQGYLNIKAYGEFDAADRPFGWNTWLTLQISPAAPGAATPRPLVTK